MVTRPVLLTVEDDPAVGRAVARDLRRRYGEKCRVVRAGSGPAALDALRELTVRGDATAAGSGLGLDNAKRIVERRHGGTIGFTTGPGGTTFTVRLPLARKVSR